MASSSLCALGDSEFCDIYARHALTGPVATELEMFVLESKGKLSPVLNVLTTVDGTIGGLGLSLTQMPPVFLEWAKDKNHGVVDLSMPWTDVPTAMQFLLLKQLHLLRSDDFYSDRRVPHIRVKPEIELFFDEPTWFLGKYYEPGVYLVDVSKSFGDVEYLGPDDFKTFAAIELHLRSNTLSAGELAKSAWSFQKAIFAQTTHLHEHELFQFPRKDKWRTKESIGLSLAMTESYRRANLLMEIYSIFRGSPIQTRRAGGVLFFDSMQPRFLSTAFEFFIDEGQGAGYKDMLKMGWVGLRGPQTYDVPGYFGFEFRSLRDVNDQMNQGAILDAIQKFMLSEQYRELNPELMNWANDSGIDLSRYQGDAALEKFWYRQGFKKLSQTLPSYLQVYFRNKLNRYIQISALQYLAGEDHAYEMLLYDWTQDPLFHGDQEGQKRLIRSQISALNAIYEGDKQPHDVLIQFLKVSGIASRTASTFGLDFKDITHPSAKAQH